MQYIFHYSMRNFRNEENSKDRGYSGNRQNNCCKMWSISVKTFSIITSKHFLSFYKKAKVHNDKECCIKDNANKQARHELFQTLIQVAACLAVYSAVQANVGKDKKPGLKQANKSCCCNFEHVCTTRSKILDASRKTKDSNLRLGTSLHVQ